MRRIPAAVAVLGLTAFALVGCSTAGASPSCERVPANPQALDAVTVSGKPGDKPTVKVAAPLYVNETSFVDLEAGHGLPITSMRQDVMFDLTVFDASTGAEIVGSGYDPDQTPVFSLTTWEKELPGFTTALHCAAEGSRVAMLLPPDEVSDGMRANLQLAEGSPALIVMDLHRVYLAAANGAPQFNDRPDMPSVVLAPDGRPGVVIPDAAAPDELVVQVLKKGDGETVTGDVPVRIHYTGLTWADREVFDSSWERGASQSMSLSSVIPGFVEALEGQTVGSQVLAVIPPDLAYGESGQGPIPGGATLVFVIDILGLDEMPGR